MAVLNKKVSGIPAGAIYIGRGSKWGNPFVMANEGQRDRVCEDYERHLAAQIERGEVTWQDLAALDGKDLVCFCAPKRCHGHTLEAYAKAATAHLLNQEAVASECGPMEYRLIVAGGRDFNDYDRLHAKLHALAEEAGAGREISIVSGMAQGADRMAHYFAQQENVKCYEFPADWDDLEVPGAVIKHTRHGKPYNAVAGHARNRRMGDFADGLLAFWDGKSRGTKQMIQYMESLGKPVIIEYWSST